MDGNYNLKINVFEFYKSASVKELKEAIAYFREAMEGAQLKMRELQSMVDKILIREAEEKVKGINAGDKVFVTYEWKSWDKSVHRKEVVGHFFDSVSLKAKESVYMGVGPFVNLNRPKKDGSRGLRCTSIRAEQIVEIRKEE